MPVTANWGAAGDQDGGDCDGKGKGEGDGNEAALTLTAVDLFTVPLALVALKVYTVDTAGDITLLPATSTWPMPLSMLTDVAPVTTHNKVDVLPASIVAGMQLNISIAGAVAVVCVELGGMI